MATTGADESSVGPGRGPWCGSGAIAPHTGCVRGDPGARSTPRETVRVRTRGSAQTPRAICATDRWVSGRSTSSFAVPVRRCTAAWTASMTMSAAGTS
jgi:hypothetical protein